MTLRSTIESLLFISNYPLTMKRLRELTGAKDKEIRAALDELGSDYEAREGSGIVLMRAGDKIQLATSPDNAEPVQEFIKDETMGELTKASLETLTIIAYRGPVTRAEIEQLRGVNCAVILRNLIMRGLIEASDNKQEMSVTYQVTLDFLKFLGIPEAKELPDYDKLNSAESLRQMLEQQGQDAKKEKEDIGEPDTVQ